MSEQRKRIQIRNILEEKSLQEKIRSYAREKNYVDKELRQILQAKESLLQGLRNASLGVPKSGGSQSVGRTDSLLSARRKSLTDTHFEGTAKSNHRRCSVPPLKKNSMQDTRISVLPGNTATIYAGNVTRGRAQSLSGRTGESDIKPLMTIDREKPEVKSCVRLDKITRKDSHVRFSFPQISEKDTAENHTFCEEGKPDQVFTPRNNMSNYKSHSDCLDEIKMKSKFLQIGSVALATAIFKSNVRRSKSAEPHNYSCLQTKKSASEVRRTTNTKTCQDDGKKSQHMTAPKPPLRRASQIRVPVDKARTAKKVIEPKTVSSHFII